MGLPAGSVVAVPPHGLIVYRLVRSDPPTEADFVSQPPRRARRSGLPELLRVGVSHFLTSEGAQKMRRYEGSSVARPNPPTRPGHPFGANRGGDHVTVWAPASEFMEAAAVVG